MLKKILLASLFLFILAGCTQQAIVGNENPANLTNTATGNHVFELEKTGMQLCG